jgi:uncharacterized membrane protein
MNKPLKEPEKKGKTPAIIGYLTIFGSILALFLNSEENKTKFASFHIRQGLGLNLVWILFGVLINGIYDYLSQTQNNMIGAALFLSYFILWLYGFLGAVSGKENKIPILGSFFQNVFKKLT